jgi:hypothetical protein
MEPKDIQLSLHDQFLTIKGEKKQEKEEKDEHYYRAERSYGVFVRTVRLPATVDGSKVTTPFKNGLLKVTLPKSATAKGTTIPIKGEQGKLTHADCTVATGRLRVDSPPSSRMAAPPAIDRLYRRHRPPKTPEARWHITS